MGCAALETQGGLICFALVYFYALFWGIVGLVEIEGNNDMLSINMAYSVRVSMQVLLIQPDTPHHL